MATNTSEKTHAFVGNQGLDLELTLKAAKERAKNDPDFKKNNLGKIQDLETARLREANPKPSLAELQEALASGQEYNKIPNDRE